MYRRWKSLSLRHTWLNPLVICATVLLLYAVNPRPSNPLHRALFLSYRLPDNHQTPRPADASPDWAPPALYNKGPADFLFVAFYTVLLSFLREFVMQKALRPMAVAVGIKSRAKQARFMEQAYMALYFSVLGPYGLWVMRQSPVWYFNTAGMYDGYPHRALEAPFKAYYLIQAGFWAQQMLVLLLMLEKPRKDFKELVIHHVLTLTLIGLSYRFHFTRMGLAVYITHDVSDFFLAVSGLLRFLSPSPSIDSNAPVRPLLLQTSKILNYLDSPILGPYFALFVGVWTYLRHYINIQIIYSVLTDFRTIGPFGLDWATQQYKCLLSQVVVFSLLASLQAINLFWLFLILRVGWRFLSSFGAVAKDERSDEEDEADADAVAGEDAELATEDAALTAATAVADEPTSRPPRSSTTRRRTKAQ